MDSTDDRLEMVIDELEQVYTGLTDVLRTELDLNLVPSRKLRVTEAREAAFKALTALKWVVKDIHCY